jgi:hypothetical protein
VSRSSARPSPCRCGSHLSRRGLTSLSRMSAFSEYGE